MDDVPWQSDFELRGPPHSFGFGIDAIHPSAKWLLLFWWDKTVSFMRPPQVLRRKASLLQRPLLRQSPTTPTNRPEVTEACSRFCVACMSLHIPCEAARGLFFGSLEANAPPSSSIAAVFHPDTALAAQCLSMRLPVGGQDRIRRARLELTVSPALRCGHGTSCAEANGQRPGRSLRTPTNFLMKDRVRDGSNCPPTTVGYLPTAGLSTAAIVFVAGTGHRGPQMTCVLNLKSQGTTMLRPIDKGVFLRSE